MAVVEVTMSDLVLSNRRQPDLIVYAPGDGVIMVWNVTLEGAVLGVEQGHDYRVTDRFVCPISHQFLRQVENEVAA